MNKAFKYKIYALLSDKKLIGITILYFIILNVQTIINSGILYQGSSSYNGILKYTLLINNFDIASIMFGMFVAIYIGTGLIGKDMETGQIYVILTASPKRHRYFMGNFLALLAVTACVVALMAVNFLLEAYALGIQVVASDLVRNLKDIMLNMTVIMTLTAVFSVFIKGYLSAFAGLAGLLLFNIYAYQKIPFIDESFNFGNVDIQNFLSNFCPVADVSAPSVVGHDVVAYYSRIPIIPNFSIYQIVYIAVLLIIGNVIFERKEL